LIPLQIGARDMASGFMNMIILVVLLSSVIMISSCLLKLDLRIQVGPYILLKCFAQAIGGSGMGMTLWLISMAILLLHPP
jgi:cytochrome c oxidase subunit 1